MSNKVLEHIAANYEKVREGVKSVMTKYDGMSVGMKMNDFIVKKLKLDTDKVPSCMNKFGNTSSASIPLTIVTQLKILVYLY